MPKPLKPFTRRYYWIVAGSTLWLLAIVGPSLSLQLGSPLGALAYLFFHPVCHQLPERSFHWWGAQLAVCQRCSGIYLGFWIGLLLLPRLGPVGGWLLRRPLVLVLFALPMLVDVLSSNSPPDRFLTGLVAGLPVSVFVVVAAEQFFSAPARRSE